MDANSFSMTCKAAREAIKKYRPEVSRLKFYIQHGIRIQALKVQGLTLPDRFGCLSATARIYGLQPSCTQIARICLINGHQTDAMEILNAQQDYLKNGILEANCFFAWYCLNIDDQQVYGFLQKDGFLGPRGLEVRSFITHFPCVIHKWIFTGQWNKFINALNFFTNDEKRRMFDERTDECLRCGNRYQGSYYFALVRSVNNKDTRFRDYLTRILYP